jgi:hypothetical protein
MGCSPQLAMPVARQRGPGVSDPPTQAEVQALRDKCEELADDVRASATLVHALRGALVAVGSSRVEW